MAELEVSAGSSYLVPSGTTEQWSSADIDGTLVVEGELLLSDPAGDGFDATRSPINLPLGPITFSTMNMGLALFLIGILSLLGGAAAVLKNYVAGALLGLAVLMLLVSGTLGVSLGAFWALLIAVVITLMAGALLRVAT